MRQDLTWRIGATAAPEGLTSCSADGPRPHRADVDTGGGMADASRRLALATFVQ